MLRTTASLTKTDPTRDRQVCSLLWFLEIPLDESVRCQQLIAKAHQFSCNSLSACPGALPVRASYGVEGGVTATFSFFS